MSTQLPPSAFEEYLLLLKFGPAVLACVAALAVRLNDPNMVIIWESELLDEMFGYAPGELRGQPLDTLLRPEDRQPHREHFARYQTVPSLRTMNAGIWVDGRKKDDTTIKVQVSLFPTAVGKEEMVIAHIVDVTAAYLNTHSPTRPMET